MTQQQVKTGIYLGCLGSSWSDFPFFRLPSYSREQSWLSGPIRKLSKYFSSVGKSSPWEAINYSLTARRTFLNVGKPSCSPNSPETTMKGRGKRVLKITHQHNCYDGRTALTTTVLAVYTDFPLGLSRASSLNSDESGTVICLSGCPCSGPPSVSLTQHSEGKEGKWKEKGNSRLSVCYCQDRGWIKSVLKVKFRINRTLSRVIAIQMG